MINISTCSRKEMAGNFFSPLPGPQSKNLLHSKHPSIAPARVQCSAVSPYHQVRLCYRSQAKRTFHAKCPNTCHWSGDKVLDQSNRTVSHSVIRIDQADSYPDTGNPGNQESTSSCHGTSCTDHSRDWSKRGKASRSSYHKSRRNKAVKTEDRGWWFINQLHLHLIQTPTSSARHCERPYRTPSHILSTTQKVVFKWLSKKPYKSISWNTPALQGRRRNQARGYKFDEDNFKQRL